MIDSCQAHMLVQYASNIEFARSDTEVVIDREAHLRGTPESHLQNKLDCFALFVFLVSHGCCVAFPHDTLGLSADCDCSVS